MIRPFPRLCPLIRPSCDSRPSDQTVVRPKKSCDHSATQKIWATFVRPKNLCDIRATEKFVRLSSDRISCDLRATFVRRNIGIKWQRLLGANSSASRGANYEHPLNWGTKGKNPLRLFCFGFHLSRPKNKLLNDAELYMHILYSITQRIYSIGYWFLRITTDGTAYVLT